MVVWSIGHSTHTWDAFLALLDAHEITTLADIRTVPKSRRHPHFHTDALARELPGHDVEYVHLAALGGWRQTVPDSPNGAWRNASFRGYADYAMTAEFAAGLEDLRTRADDAKTAMMCSEALWWRCHRRLVADRLVLGGDEVRHIGSDGRTQTHEITAFATVRGDQLVYPGDDEQA
jgi:uncharacterized protein (DUF488 family)